MGKSTTENGWTDQFYTSAAYFSGGCIYQASDERLKDFHEDVKIDLDELAGIPKKYYTWKGDENGGKQIGTSAQKIKELFPEIVGEDEDGTLSVSYDRLSIIALAAIDALHKENEEMKARIEALEYQS